jgi:hypothetical protein
MLHSSAFDDHHAIPTTAAITALGHWTPPMSLRVGGVRVSLGTEPMVDILFDTSDSDRHLKPTAYVAFTQRLPRCSNAGRRKWSASTWELSSKPGSSSSFE